MRSICNLGALISALASLPMCLHPGQLLGQPSPSPVARLAEAVLAQPSPTDPPVPQDACYYRVKIAHDNRGVGVKVLGGDADELTCLERIVEDAVFSYTGAHFTGGMTWADYIRQAFSLTISDEQFRSVMSDPIARGISSGWVGAFLSKYDDLIGLYLESLLGTTLGVMDRNCLPVSWSETHNICGLVDVYYWCPLSLVFDAAAAETEGPALVRFRLDPSQPEQWYTWRASEHLPLLVYSPGRLAAVETGAQLFSHWTFKDPQLASLASPNMRDTAERGRVWKNGFEPLASLDEDGDGKLTGAELAPLALWFDRDRDGKSQEGELRRLEELGIVSLSVTPDRTDSATGDLIATGGYERVVDGRRVSGAMVDWFADGARSKGELALRAQLYHDLTANNAARELLNETETDPAADAGAGARGTRLIDGVWRWRMEGANDEGAQAQGLLTLQDQGNQNIRGRVLMQIPARPNERGAAWIIRAIPFRGRRETTAEGSMLSFSFHAPEGSFTSSRAVLASDGSRLTGTSIANVPRLGRPDSEFRYGWTAERLRLRGER